MIGRHEPDLRSKMTVTREIITGTVADRSAGGTGLRAMWQWTHSIGSDALNGSEPVSIR